MTRLTCDECGFDEELWSDEDLAQTLIKTDDLVGQVLAGADPTFVADATQRPILVDDDPVASVHALMHRLNELAIARRNVDVFEPMVGRVHSLQVSGGGVPKPQVPLADVTVGGVVGDAQNDRIHHGRPWQAVCLYSTDILAALRDEGHPIDAGDAGENVTVSGIDWTQMRGGLTIDIGAVRLRTSRPVTPCYKIAASFSDRNWNRIHPTERPGWARWYASVISGGTIRPGDAVTIEA